jgi:diguanylate cyclase (GGDEF)-like protein
MRQQASDRKPAVIEWLIERLMHWVGDDLEEGINVSLRRKQFVISSIPWMLVFLVFFYNVVFISTGNLRTMWTGFVQIPIVLIGNWLISQTQKRQPDRTYWVVAIVLVLDLLAAIHAGQGNLINTHFYFLVLAMVVTLIIPVESWLPSLFLSVASLLIFLWYEFFPITPHPDMLTLEAGEIAMLQISVYVSMMVVIFLSIFFNEMFAVVLERKLHRMATTDALTGLLNRRGFQHAIDRDLANAERYGTHFSLALADIDHFKLINDTHGHEGGDEMLRHVATVLKQQVRKGDVVARLGGEEFVILMPSTPQPMAVHVCNRIRSTLEHSPGLVGELQIPVTISMGVTEWAPGVPGNELVDDADQALYAAKGGGRNRVCEAARNGAAA